MPYPCSGESSRTGESLGFKYPRKEFEMAVKSTAEARGFGPGKWVFLKAYRKVRGNDHMDALRLSLVGDKALITGFLLNEDGSVMKDGSGCILVNVQVCGRKMGNTMIGGHQLSWRLSSLRKINNRI